MLLTFSEKFMINLLDSNYSRKYVRTKLQLPFIEFNKSPFSENTSDMFAESKFMITYDKDDNVKEIEIYNDVEFDLLGEKIFKPSFGELKEIFQRLNILYEIADSCVITKNKRFEFYFPDLDDDGDGAKLESILLLRTANFK